MTREEQIEIIEKCLETPEGRRLLMDACFKPIREAKTEKEKIVLINELSGAIRKTMLNLAGVTESQPASDFCSECGNPENGDRIFKDGLCPRCYKRKYKNNETT